MGNSQKTSTRPGNFYLATDSEWDTSRPTPWLSTAFACHGGVVVFITPELVEDVKDRLTGAASELGVNLVFRDRNDQSNLLLEALSLLGVEEKAVRLLMYFSPKDIEYATGWQCFHTAIKDKKVRQRNNISGTLHMPGRRVCIKDLCGWAGKTSLLKFAQSLGVHAPDKTVMDDYKTIMHRGLTERPEDFLRYAVGDVTMLLELHSAFVEHFRTLQQECLDMMGEDLWTADDIPMTGGALVAKTLERWLYRRGKDRSVMQFAVRKLGLLDPDDVRYKFSKWAYCSVTSRCRTTHDLRKALANNDLPKDLAQFLKARFLHTALDGCSVKWWAGRPVTETAGFNALVHGGRCHNENPYSYSLGRGADIDIAGCYGEALRALSYPVGLPTVLNYTPNQPRLNLGEFLDQYEHELEPGLWTATVGGPLDFEQDLIHSKLVKHGDIRKASGSKEENSDIPSDLVLLRREIKNGILTSDLLKALRSVATNAEWAGFRKLELVTAAAYLKRNRRETPEAWCEAVLQDDGNYWFEDGAVRDTRTRAWVQVPLDDFVGRMCDRRRHYKVLARTAASEEARGNAQGMDAMLKLTVNMVYGAMAARFFAISNSVVANNITALARLGAWMMAKALALRQTITDGGAYTPGQVCFFVGKRPGLDTLSRPWEWHNPKCQRWLRPLAGRDWSTSWPDLAELDGLALDHVRQFWQPYGITFPFRAEHKTAISKGAYWSKGDYGFLLPSGALVYAVRGKDKRQKTRQHPTFELLDRILGGQDTFPGDLVYTHKSIMKIGKYQTVQSCRGYENLKGLRPGDDYLEERVARYNNTYFPLADEQDYLRRRNRRKIHRGRPVQWFEKYGLRGIDHVHRQMVRNTLR